MLVTVKSGPGQVCKIAHIPKHYSKYMKYEYMNNIYVVIYVIIPGRWSVRNRDVRVNVQEVN